MKVKPPKAKQASKPTGKVQEKPHKVAAKTSPVNAAGSRSPTKPAPRPIEKPTPKPAARAPARPQPARAMAKVASGPAGKTPPKPVGRPPKKSEPQPVLKTSVEVPRTNTKTAPAPRTQAVVQVKPQARPEVPAAPPVLAASPMAPATTQRAGRPSSRLASLTVPSMAQSVASTAAKASYSQLTSTPMIVPPLPSAAKKDPKLANNWKTKPAELLSDAELLAMPDSEYMNDKQMAAFRLKLSSLKREILNSAGETTEHLREDTVVVPDPADRATIEEEHALELRTRDRERKLLKKIEQSISRIDSGDYGYCDETGEPIGVGRLLARPTATLSLEAQQRRELKQKMFGD